MQIEREQPKKEQSIAIAALPIETLPRELQKPARSFQRQAVAMRRLPVNIRDYEEAVTSIFEKFDEDEALLPHEVVATILSDPNTLSQIFAYYLVGAEVDLATRRLENNATEIINKSTKAHKTMPDRVRTCVDTMLQVIDDLDCVNPFDAVPEQSPTLIELANANTRIGEWGYEFSTKNQAIRGRIPNLFVLSDDPEDIGHVIFFAYIGKRTGSWKKDFNEFLSMGRTAGISAEAVTSIREIADLLDDYYAEQIENLHARMQGERYDASRLAPLTAKSYLPAALAAYATSDEKTSMLLPTNFALLLTNDFIPGLDPSAAKIFIEDYTKHYYTDLPDVMERQADNGLKPYKALAEYFDSERSLEWLNELVQYYPTVENGQEFYEELYWEKNKLRAFLGKGVDFVYSDEHIAAMYVGSSEFYLDIILLSPDHRALGIQIDPYSPFTRPRFHGIPGGYIQESQSFVENILGKALTHLRDRGYLDIPDPREHDRSEESRRTRQEFEDRLRTRLQMEGQKESSPEHTVAFQTAPAEVILPQKDRVRRFTITDPKDIISKSDLSEFERAALEREIEEVEFSTPGTYPLRKMTGYKGDYRRLKVKTTMTTPSGGKVRVDLRAALEFDGTSASIVKVSNRQGVYKELDALLR